MFHTSKSKLSVGQVQERISRKIVEPAQRRALPALQDVSEAFTFRLVPASCRYTSGLVIEGLHVLPGTTRIQRQVVVGGTLARVYFAFAGLHDGVRVYEQTREFVPAEYVNDIPS